MVHSGFFSGAKAVNRRLKELVVAACAGTPGEWEILVTGHSLGGALATLTAFDIGTDVDTSRGFRSRADNSWFGQAVSFVTQKGKEVSGTAPVRLRLVRLYTFGAPRVGNSEFARAFEELGMEAYRIVNGQDIVARMPRHANSAGALLDYEHVGRTVLVDEEGEVADGFWVEGASSDAACPLRDVSPLTNPFGPGTVMGDIGSRLDRSASSLFQRDEGAAAGSSSPIGDGGLKELARSLGSAVAELGEATADIQSRVESMRPAEALSLIGLDARFVESEVKMIESITRGTFLTHHLEPSYYEAMLRALNARQREELDEELDASGGAGGG